MVGVKGEGGREKGGGIGEMGFGLGGGARDSPAGQQTSACCTYIPKIIGL